MPPATTAAPTTAAKPATTAAPTTAAKPATTTRAAALDVPAPATPEWRVRDVLAHMVGVADDIVNASFGFKFSIPNGFTAITNALIPLNRGGLRANVTYTAGLEYTF